MLSPEEIQKAMQGQPALDELRATCLVWSCKANPKQVVDRIELLVLLDADVNRLIEEFRAKIPTWLGGTKEKPLWDLKKLHMPKEDHVHYHHIHHNPSEYGQMNPSYHTGTYASGEANFIIDVNMEMIKEEVKAITSDPEFFQGFAKGNGKSQKLEDIQKKLAQKAWQIKKEQSKKKDPKGKPWI